MEQSEPAFVFHATAIDQAVTLLNSDKEKGLTNQKAAELLQQFGSNTIEETSALSAFKILANQFKSPIVYLLFFAVLLSFWFKEWLDGFAILLVIFINTAIGFYMEFSAQRSVLALKKLSSIPAKVIREGKLTTVNGAELVPGDLVFTEAGDMVPADGIIVTATQFLIDESALTGESVPVEKKGGVLPESTVLGDRINMAFKATHVVKGNGHLLICATGMQTELGKIAHLVQSAKQSATPLEKKLDEFSKKLIKITVVLVVVIFITGLINGIPIIEMLQTAIALAVAAIPEGLPIVATMTLAQGMLKMSRDNVIVKKLSAVETLGGTNVICTDKTGTLTQNKMEVVQVETPDGNWKKDTAFAGNKEPLTLIAQCAVLCNTANIETPEKEIGDPLEIALLKFAVILGQDIDKIRKAFIKKSEEPFSSETKIMYTLHEQAGKLIVFAKGAPEELMPHCTQIFHHNEVAFEAAQQKTWLSNAEKSSAAGQRMIGMGYRRLDAAPQSLHTEGLVFLGLVGMLDPPRPEVQAAIHDCKTAGIKLVMITGDHPATAHFIATQLGISTKEEMPIIGKDMKEFKQLTDPEKEHWLNTAVFARVTPKHKLDLVQVFQEKGYVVGMTGDGVNDAPAIKQSDIGIAMGLRGTQVAQEVADMVLKDDSFLSIVVAIREGRIIFDNIKKFVTFLLSCNLSELVVIAVVATLNLHFQLLPLQILFINLITDLLPALALGVISGSETIMQLPPRKSTEPIIDKNQWKIIFFYSLVIAAVSSVAVLFNHYQFDTAINSQDFLCNNILFFTLIFCQLLHVFNMGTGKFFNNEVINNKFIWFAVLGSVALLLGVIQIPFVRLALKIVPMTFTEWIIILSAALSSVMLIQAGKYFYLRGGNNEGNFNG